MTHGRSLLKVVPSGKISLTHLTMLVLLMLVAYPFFIDNSSGATYGSTVRGPIFIDGDVNFTPQNGVTSGSGTVDDPFIISGWEINTTNSHAIEVINARAYFIIKNVTITTNGASEMSGIILSFSENGTVSDSYIYGCDRGIEIWSCNNIHVNNCLIVGKAEEGYYKGIGVNLDFSRNSFFTGNTITDCLNGIAFNYHSGSIAIRDNEILRCVAAGIEVFRANGVLVEDNHFELNDAGSIVLAGANNARVANNTIEGSRIGIRIGDIYQDSIVESVVHDNIISNCTEIGLKIDDARFYKFYHNDFISNAIQVRATVKATWDNGYPFGGNYWSEMTTEDSFGGPSQTMTGADGIIDTVRYVGSLQDSYPLVHQKAVRDAVVISDLPVNVTPGVSSVSIEWNGSVHLDGINQLVLFRAEDEAPSNYSLVSAHYADAGSLNDTGLTNGDRYYFQLIGTGDNGIVARSDITSSIPRTVPNSPMINSIVEGNGNVSLSWEPGFNGGSSILFYSVYRNGTHLGNVTGTDYLDTGLVKKVVYNYKVRAHNIVGMGEESASVSAAPYGAPIQPSDLQAQPMNGAVLLSWVVPLDDGGRSVDGYSVIQNDTWLLDTTDLVVRIEGLVNDVVYNFTVAAHNIAGSGPGVTVVVSPNASVPNPPYDITAVTGDGSIYVSWSSPTSDGGNPIVNYTLFRSINGGEWKSVITTSVENRSFLDLDIVAGYTYAYSVMAVNALGSSVPSASTNEVTARYLLNIEINTDSSSTNLGVIVRMYGQVTYSDHHLPVSSIGLSISYSTNSGQTWTELPSANTDITGNFEISWIPPATGVYMVRVAWAGDHLFYAAENYLNLAIDSSVADSVLSVQSNSQISNFIFDTVNKKLSFTVSGEDGTEGYVKIIVSKSILENATSVNITLDGVDMNYTLSSTEQSWILMFEYHHSTHDVVADLKVSSEVIDDDPDADSISDSWMYVLVIGSVIAAFVAAAVFMTKKKE